MSSIVKIGKKGEIIPPAKLRRKLGFSPGKKVKIDVVDNKIIIEIFPTPLEQLKKKKLAKVSLSELNESSTEIQKEWLSEDD